MVLRKCFVPKCPHTSENSKKIFLSVPRNEERRRLWFKCIGKDKFRKRMLFCCEDHFNLENDAENWLYFKTIGQKIFLKKYSLPHLNLSSPTPKSSTESQISSSSKEMKLSTLRFLNENKPGGSRELLASQLKKCDSHVSDSPTLEEYKIESYIESRSGKINIPRSTCHKVTQIADDINTVQFERNEGTKRLNGDDIPHKSTYKSYKKIRLSQETEDIHQNEANIIKQEIDDIQIKDEPIDIYEEFATSDIKTEPTDSIYEQNNLIDSIKTEPSNSEVQSENVLEPLAIILLPTIKSENYVDENEDPLSKL